METKHNFLQAGGQPVSDRMRELLARAAQDHVYEQRSQSQVLDEVRQRLEGLEWLLREVRERELNGLTGQIDGVRELFGRPPGWAEGLAEHIEAMGERVKPVAELPALWADVGVVAENVDETLGRLQYMTDSAQHIVAAAEQASQRMDEMSKRLDRLQGNMEASAVRFNRLDKSVAELGHRAERLEHSVGDVSSRVDRSLGELGDRIERGLDAVNGRVEGVGGRLDGLDGRLEGLSGKLTGLDGRLEALDDRLGRLPAELDAGGLHSMLDDLVNRPVIDQGHRFDELEKRLADAVDPLIDELRARPDRQEVEAAMAQVARTARADVAERMEEFTAQVDIVSRRVESVHGDVTKQVESVAESVHEDVGKGIEEIHAVVAKQLGGFQDDFRRRVGGVQEDLARRVDGVQDEVSRRTDALHTEVGRRVEGVQEEVGKKVDSVHEHVAKQMDSVHEDVLKRLSTLEETMLALAEALLRPRRDGKD